MDYDADLIRPISSSVPGTDEPAEAAPIAYPFIGSVVAKVVAPAGTAAAESSLIEEAWISDKGERGCDHYLEHRLMAQEYEGLRMGRELHDSTGQLLLSLRLSIARLREISEPGKLNDVFDEISETACQIDHEIRAFSYLHYPAELGKEGLVAALRTLARGFGDRTGLKIAFKAICDRATANGAASIALLRVAQEALMNVHRHAHAGQVRMSLVKRGGMLELSVQDDGQGMPPPTSDAVTKGLGLQGMRHRVERLGGSFSIKRLKHGTKIVASLANGREPLQPLRPDSGKTQYLSQAQ